MTLNTTNILRRSRRALGTQNYILENSEMVLRGLKEVLGRSEKALVAIKRFLGDLKGPWELSKFENLSEPEGRHGEILRSEEL